MLVRRRVGRRVSGEVKICVGEVVRIADQLVGCFGGEGVLLEGLVESSSSRTSPCVWPLLLAFWLNLSSLSGEEDEAQKLGHRITRLSLTSRSVDRRLLYQINL